MKHSCCTLADLNLDMQEVYLTMGYKNAVPEEDILSLTDQVIAEIGQICVPQYIYEIYEGNVQDNVSIDIHGIRFRTGKMITSYLEGCDRFCVFATTAGHEYETYKMQARKDGDSLKEFIADSIGSVIAETLVAKITEELQQITPETTTYPYSPGYCGWKLTEQTNLFSLLPDSPCGITLTDSCLMLPIKSISGIMAVGKNITKKAYGCAICENIHCYKRKQTQ